VTVILIRPAYDRETRMTYEMAASAKSRLSLSADLGKQLATTVDLQQALQEDGSVTVLAFYGHGGPDRLLGHPWCYVIDRSVVSSSGPRLIPPETEKLQIYAVACRAGGQLGPRVASCGGRFVGYSDDFVVTYGFEKDFGIVINDILITLVKDWGTPQQCQDLILSKWNELIDDFSLGPKSSLSNAWLAARDAVENREGASCF
jgi:hypothetical protein